MRRRHPLRWALPVLATGLLSAQSAALPEVHEATLPNGMRVLLVERPGSGMMHASVTFARPLTDSGRAPAVAYELLRRCWAAPEPPAGRVCEKLLAQEDGFWSSLREASGAPVADLKALHAAARQELEGQRVSEGGMPQARLSQLTADDLHLGYDLPASELDVWAQGLTERLRGMVISAFPEVRDRWVEPTGDGNSDPEASSQALGLLLPASLGGGTYGTAASFGREAVAEVRWESLRTLGLSLATPDRMTLVLVGDFVRDKALTALRNTLGTLPESRTASVALWQGSEGVEDAWTGRRLQAFSEGESRVMLALRVPRMGRRDDRALRVLAEVLAGGPSSRLWHRLVVEQNLASRVAAHLGVPGVREAHLLVLEARPFQGRTLQELEQGLHAELARLLREGISREDVREAQLRAEAAETLIQDDAGTLAQALGQAQARSGQWAAGFPALGAGGRMPEVAVHQLLRVLAQPAGMVTLSLEPDTLLTPQDPSEARLIRLLSDRVGRSVPDPVAQEGIVRQSVQQLRLLSPAERARILALLEAESR